MKNLTKDLDPIRTYVSQVGWIPSEIVGVPWVLIFGIYISE